MRLAVPSCGLAILLSLLFGLSISPGFAQEENEISPACGDYQRNVIIIDGFVNSPTTVTP